MVKKYLPPKLVPAKKDDKPMKMTKKSSSEKPPARKEMAQGLYQQLRSKPSNVEAPLPMEEMPKIGSPEPTRRLPGMRVMGNKSDSRGGKYIGALYDSQKLYADSSKPHYRERASRVIKMEESPLSTKIKHTDMVSEKVDMPTTQRSVMPSRPSQEMRARGGRVPTTREMAQQTEDESLQDTMIETSDMLKPSVNKLGVIKKDVLPNAPVKVDNEPHFRVWKELRVGEHIPSADVPPFLTIHPKQTDDDFHNKMTGANVEISEKKPRKPRKAKVVSGMVEMKEEEIVSKPKGVVKTEVEKIEKVEKKTRAKSAYNEFVAEHRKQGATMKEIGEMWRQSKE